LNNKIEKEIIFLKKKIELLEGEIKKNQLKNKQTKSTQVMRSE
jgi:hypothetical protein